jgi:hypothetical protein
MQQQSSTPFVGRIYTASLVFGDSDAAQHAKSPAMPS